MKTKNFQAAKEQSAALLAWAQSKETEMVATATIEKTADIRYRVEIKNKPWIVIYKVMSSNGVDMYDVTVCNGKVNNCKCPSHKPCYHMKGVQEREDERTPRLSRDEYTREFGIYQ